ncbi:hypothetical protein THAOC_27927 [Thalassiosira oceanica]|uniref:F-box domain-containing protein n=1 Tax=Thalassiosira oceanica TaxID=159749 RepID=K0RHQ9_THAOC|nr:hypothetical protein THAOC_27927 [Thalassiosira oceanica]|eukprot:EJK52770.1 hypothetical protein THAOC_27927 [Thalassiosira oceanica]
MADDQSNKRPKNGPGASGGDARVDALESEIRALRQQLRRSDAENASLRGQLRRLRRDHDVLPVVPSLSVDLSRLDAGLVTRIVSYLGTSPELRNVALTCKSFGWQQPSTGLDLSSVEEVARQVVCSGRNDIEGVRITLPQFARGTTTWLSILHESEHPLKFDKLLGRGIRHTNERKTSVHAGGFECTAVASNYVMESGIHYAEFQINKGNPFIGIVRPTPNLTTVGLANEAVISLLIYGMVNSWMRGLKNGAAAMCTRVNTAAEMASGVGQTGKA